MTIRDHHPRQKKRSNLRDERETPQKRFDEWNKRWKFTVDAAASAKNAKLEHYWTKKTDGLKQSWRGHRVWCNPPFSDIGPWVEKARSFEAELAVLLVPVWTDRKWFQAVAFIMEEFLSHQSEPSITINLEFLSGRLCFGKPRAKTPDGPAPFPCMLMIFERVKKHDHQ